MTNCIEETGKTLTLNNQDIVRYLCSIEEERNTLDLIIQKQYQERKKIEAEIERLTYKLCLINKSLSMRIRAKNNYDRTIEEIKSHYQKLVDSSNALKQIVEKTQQDLDDIMNKRTGTNAGPNGEEIRMLYVKPNENPDSDECPCVYIAEPPTREYQVTSSSLPPRESSRDFNDPESGGYTDSDQPTDTTGTYSDDRPCTEMNSETNRVGEEKLSNEELEVEVNAITPLEEETDVTEPIAPQNEDIQTTPAAEDNSNHSSTLDSGTYDTSANPLPDPKSQQENKTTNMLISRLRISLTKYDGLKQRQESSIKPRRSTIDTGSFSLSRDSSYPSQNGGIEKKDAMNTLSKRDSFK